MAGKIELLQSNTIKNKVQEVIAITPNTRELNKYPLQLKQVLYCCVFFIVACMGCRQKYVPQLNLPATSFLVVEGYINSGTGPTTITLSRTIKLSDTAQIMYEAKALVRVEGKQNTTGIVLPETGRGVYSIPQLTLNPNDQYRVYIKTTNGKEYVSAYSAVRRTPDIDSVTWKEERGGLQLFVHSHDPQSKTRYYQYAYDENWEYRSLYYSSLKVIIRNDTFRLVYRDSSTFNVDSAMYRCWKSNRSSAIVTATTEHLSQDVLANMPLTFIEGGSFKLSHLYTVLVKQKAVSREGYQFLGELKKNTEQLGSIFDAQPSDNNGNIRCITNASEIAIGFVEVSEEKQKRIWITKADLPNWQWSRVCDPELSVVNHPDSIGFGMEGGAYLFTVPIEVTSRGVILRAGAASATCVDCRVYGSEPKPPFWP